jgi:hypothetical protein
MDTSTSSKLPPKIKIKIQVEVTDLRSLTNSSVKKDNKTPQQKEEHKKDDLD